MKAQVKAVITAASDTVVANLIVEAFMEVQKHFHLKAWKTSELDSGHFVEGVRRLLEHRLFGHYTHPRALPLMIGYLKQSSFLTAFS
jgi:hypothetical protein